MFLNTQLSTSPLSPLKIHIKNFASAFALCGAVVISTLFSHQAKADLLIEPYFGAGIGEMKASYSDGSGDLKYNTDGINVGARIAVALPIVYFGADFDLQVSQAKTDSNPHSYFGNTNLTSQALFGFVGVHLPLLRAWAGYGVLDRLNFASSNGYSARQFSGTAMKVGVGFTGLPFIDLNVEYIASTFTDRPSIGGATFDKATQGTVVFSASLPLTF